MLIGFKGRKGADFMGYNCKECESIRRERPSGVCIRCYGKRESVEEIRAWLVILEKPFYDLDSWVAHTQYITEELDKKFPQSLSLQPKEAK